MKNEKHNYRLKRKNQSGQIVVISLFTLAIFMVIGASIATQMVFEQKKAVLEKKTKEAYYAAESGVEQALEEILDEEGGDPPASTPLEIGGATGNVTIKTEAGGSTFVVPSLRLSGEHFILNLAGYNQDAIRLCWDKPGFSFIATLFYREGIVDPVEKTYTYAINTEGAENITDDNIFDNILTGDEAQKCILVEGSTYGVGLDYGSLTIDDYQYLVIWTSYESGVQLFFEGLNGGIIPTQGSTIVSTAEVVEGDSTVTRRVRYFVSSIGTVTYDYPPGYLLSPVYSVGGVEYGPGVNW